MGESCVAEGEFVEESHNDRRWTVSAFTNTFTIQHEKMLEVKRTSLETSK